MTSIKIELAPFIAPDYVSIKGRNGLKQDGFRILPQYSLNELDEQTLSDLCDEFRMNVFLKAGKDDPKKIRLGSC